MTEELQKQFSKYKYELEELMKGDMVLNYSKLTSKNYEFQNLLVSRGSEMKDDQFINEMVDFVQMTKGFAFDWKQQSERKFHNDKMLSTLQEIKKVEQQELGEGKTTFIKLN